ncbi:putative reverse transcriptase domain, ribonuclease H-like domain, aspartic peptidase domain protein [Tanacetum coccineum]
MYFPSVNGSSTHRHTLSQSETFKTIGLGYESIHACEHDCCLFRGDNNKDLDFCPVCNTSRWKDSNTPGKKVPKKVLRYFPIIPRLQRLYKSSHTAKDIFGNATGKVTEPEIVPTRLLLMVFNPLGNLSHPTACAGDIEQHNNLPPWTEGFMDLKGVETIAFVQARSYKACLTCNEDTPYVRVLSKTDYVGHRRFLKCPINGGVALEFNAKHDNTDPPKEWPDSLEGGPIRPRWMYPFERYMKKLKGYVRNKAKPEGSIAEGYVAEEALTFSSHYFRDVTTKFNRPDRNVDPPPSTCRPEIDTYRSQFKSLFPNKDMQEEFPDWFGSQIRQRHVDNDQDPEVSTTSELFALANGPSWTPISINSCVVDGVRYVVHSRDERRTTQNSGICSPGPDGEMYYGQLQEIIEFKYLLFKVALFRVKWFDTSNKGRKVNKLVLRNNMTQIDCSREAFKDDQYILVTQVKQVFYLEDKTKPHWKVVEHVNHKKFSDGGVIVVEDDPDIIHFDNSSDLPLSTSLNDLDNATLHIDGQSTVVDAPPDIIDVPDEDDDIIDDEDALPHDLADSDVEDLINVDDDGVEKMSSADVARSHGGDGGGDDRPPSHVVPTGCGGCFANKGKGPVPISFDVGDKHTLNPLGPHAAHWSNYVGEVVRSVSLYYPSWEKVPKERKATIISDIGTMFDLRPHMDSSRWTEIYESINQHLQKAYNTNKASFKARQARLEEITADEWDKYIRFWNDPKNLARAAQNRKNRQKSMEEMKRLEATGEYTEDEINRLARGGKLRGHIPGVGRVLPARATSRPSMPAPDKSLKSIHKKVNFMMSLFRSDSKYSDMFKEFESGGASGSGGCGDDEESGDDEEGEDEDGDGDSYLARVVQLGTIVQFGKSLIISLWFDLVDCHDYLSRGYHVISYVDLHSDIYLLAEVREKGIIQLEGGHYEKNKDFVLCLSYSYSTTVKKVFVSRHFHREDLQRWLSSEFTQSSGGSSDTSEGSENSGSFEDYGSSDED